MKHFIIIVSLLLAHCGLQAQQLEEKLSEVTVTGISGEALLKDTPLPFDNVGERTIMTQ